MARNFSRDYSAILSHDGLRCVEPKKRLCGGKYGWAIHRFPIKGGLNFYETVWSDFVSNVAKNVSRNNSLFERFMEKSNKTA